MAEKRMFTKKIVNSDSFLDMPLSAQALYFHLNMQADDDGFVNNPKKIQRMIGAAEDDLKLLIVKRFLLGFDSGVIVIKHWRMHNLLRKDRYNPTQYQEEFQKLQLKDNGSYTEGVEIPTLPDDGNLTATLRQPNDTPGKDRLGKDRLGKDRLDYKGIFDAYNRTCPSLPAIKNLSEARKKAIRARLNYYSHEDILEAFIIAENSDFLKGKNNRNWRADFDWIMKDANMAKILDGKYNNNTSQPEDVAAAFIRGDFDG